MKHLAAYLLLGLAGNTSPSASDIKGVLDSVGIEADDERLKKLLSELEGKNIQDVGDPPTLFLCLWHCHLRISVRAKGEIWPC
jgi:hypothetical protein